MFVFRKSSRITVTLFAALVACQLLACGNSVGQDATTVAIEPTGDVEKVHDGFLFTEGPAWDGNGTLYFTDIPTRTIYKLNDGNLSKLTTDSKSANGLMVATDGRLFACQMTGSLVSYDTKTGKETVVADKYEGQRFNAPNDLVIDKLGGVYFTDPHYRAPKPWPQEILAVYYASPDGTVSRVTDAIEAPNGVGLSPDERHLYVIPSGQAEMLVYNVDGPGKLSGQRTFCSLKQPEGKSGGGGDGMTVDVKGNLYITSKLGVQIFSPSGDALGIIEFPEQPSNVAFGDSDRKTLYTTARRGLYKVKMPIAGLPSS